MQIYIESTTKYMGYAYISDNAFLEAILLGVVG